MALSPPRFVQVRLREGYAIDEVDAYVEHITSALSLDDPDLTADEVDAVRFQPATLGAGYDMAQVDMWLYQVAAELRARASGEPPTVSMALSPGPPATPPAAPGPAPTSSSPPPSRESGESPAQGLFRWPAVAVVLPLLALVVAAAWFFTR